MECKSCHNTVTPGMEIVIDQLTGEWIHCPYCLQQLEPEADYKEKGNSAEQEQNRRGIRRNVRERFVQRLIEQSDDGKLYCPVCASRLTEGDRSLLVENEHFRCPLCFHDLATHAYREEAYHVQRWLPVILALSDQLKNEDCECCVLVGAIARASQKALAWIPKSDTGLRSNLNSILLRSAWKQPSCDLEACTAVKQYRNLAGGGILMP